MYIAEGTKFEPVHTLYTLGDTFPIDLREENIPRRQWEVHTLVEPKKIAKCVQTGSDRVDILSPRAHGREGFSTLEVPMRFDTAPSEGPNWDHLRGATKKVGKNLGYNPAFCKTGNYTVPFHDAMPYNDW